MTILFLVNRSWTCEQIKLSLTSGHESWRKTSRLVSPDCVNTPAESRPCGGKTPAGPAAAGCGPPTAAPDTWTAPPADYGFLGNKANKHISLTQHNSQHLHVTTWDIRLRKASLIQAKMLHFWLQLQCDYLMITYFIGNKTKYWFSAVHSLQDTEILPTISKRCCCKSNLYKRGKYQYSLGSDLCCSYVFFSNPSVSAKIGDALSLGFIGTLGDQVD